MLSDKRAQVMSVTNAASPPPPPQPSQATTETASSPNSISAIKPADTQPVLLPPTPLALPVATSAHYTQRPHSAELVSTKINK